MKKLLIGLAAVVVVVAAALVAAPLLIPLDTYKREIATRVSAATGRELTIAGDMRLSFVPRLGVEVADVAFANAPGAAEPNMLTLETLIVDVAFWPLLTGAVAVDRFVLVEPVINLEIDARGRPNWVFTAVAPAGEVAEEAPDEPAPGTGAGLSQITLGDVRVEDGVIAFRDASGAVYRLDDVDATLALPAFDAPLAARGGATFNGERISLAATAATPARLAAGEPATVALSLEARPLTLAFDGSVAAGVAPRAEGTVKLDVASVRDLAAWLGRPVELPGTGLGRLAVEGEVAVDGATYGFRNARLRLDDIAGRGEVVADLGGARPAVTARLDVGRLDLNPYLPPEPAAAGGDAAAGGGAAAPAAWSTEPIDVAPLRALDADVAVTAEAIVYRAIETGRGALAARLEDGVLALDVDKLRLYGGAGRVRARLDGSGDVPAVEAALTLDGVEAKPLLGDAAGFTRVSGTFDAEVAVTAAGRSQRDMVEALDGSGSFRFVDGVIEGVDLGAMVRNVAAAFDRAGGARQSTEFAEFAGSFTIVDGIATNDDTRMRAPLFRLAAAGTVDIPARTLKYRLRPKLAATTEGQGGADDALGIAVPVIVEGPWHDLAYRPDLEGIVEEAVKTPGDAVGTAKGIAEGVLEGAAGAGEGAAEGVKGLLEGLFGD